MIPYLAVDKSRPDLSQHAGKKTRSITQVMYGNPPSMSPDARLRTDHNTVIQSPTGTRRGGASGRYDRLHGNSF